MNKLLKRLNDKANQVLRNWPWRSRQAVFAFEPLSGGSNGPRFVVLCTPGRFAEGLWTLYSFMVYLRPLSVPVLVVDGELTGLMRMQFERLFPGGELLSTAELEDEMDEALHRFVRTHWAGRKLKALYHLQQRHAIVYADNDILVFNRPEWLINEMTGGVCRAAHMWDRSGYIVDAYFERKFMELRGEVPHNFNSGMLVMPQGVMDSRLLHAVLEDWKPVDDSHFAEQSLISLLIGEAGGCAMPQEEYLICHDGYKVWESDRDPAQLVVRHYVGPVRQRMYQTGYRYLLKSGLGGRARAVAAK